MMDSFSKDKQFLIYAYQPPMKARYLHDIITKERYLNNKEHFDNNFEAELVDDEKVYIYQVVKNQDGSIKDFRTVESFKDELDCGMNVLFLQRNACEYFGEDFETSELKAILDIAYQAGYANRVVFFDDRLHSLSMQTEPLVGENRKFKTDEELTAYCADCLNDYKHHPAFFGIYLLDEPNYKTLPQVCEAYRAIRRADDKVFIQTNLLPLAGDASAAMSFQRVCRALFVDIDLPENKGLSLLDCYKKYIETFATLSDADYITMDSYPIREICGYKNDLGHYDEPEFYKREGERADLSPEYYISKTHFPCLQILGEASKKHNKALCGLALSCSMTKMQDDYGNVLMGSHKAPDERDMRYQTNAYMAFGMKSFSYYVYWAKRDNGPGCYHVPETCFIDRLGNKTQVYFDMQKIHKEMQELAKVIYDYKYSAMTWVGDSELPYLYHCKKDKLIKLENAELLGGESAVITELKTDDGKLLYAVLYSAAPASDGSDNACVVNLTFDKSVKKVGKACGSSLEPIALEKGGLTLALKYGDCIFLTVE